MTKLDTLLACLPESPFRQQLTDEIESLRHDNTSLLHLLAKIRDAALDEAAKHLMIVSAAQNSMGKAMVFSDAARSVRALKSNAKDKSCKT